MLAVKQVEMPQTTSDKDNELQSSVVAALHFEIETLKDLDHPNIVQFLGMLLSIQTGMYTDRMCQVKNKLHNTFPFS